MMVTNRRRVSATEFTHYEEYQGMKYKHEYVERKCVNSLFFIRVSFHDKNQFILSPLILQFCVPSF